MKYNNYLTTKKQKQMIESVEEFNYILQRLKEKHKQKKLGGSLKIKLLAFKQVEKLINQNK